MSYYNVKYASDHKMDEIYCIIIGYNEMLYLMMMTMMLMEMMLMILTIVMLLQLLLLMLMVVMQLMMLMMLVLVKCIRQPSHHLLQTQTHRDIVDSLLDMGCDVRSIQ